MSISYKIKPDFSNLVTILDEYDEILTLAEGDLTLVGKTLHDANRDQPIHVRYYSSKLVEIKSLQKHIDARANVIRGTLWGKFKENHSISLGTRDIDQYIAKEPSYSDVMEIIVLVSETVQQFEVLVEAFKSRGFALRNITNARIAEVQEFIL
jgi:hypothetical protein